MSVIFNTNVINVGSGYCWEVLLNLTRSVFASSLMFKWMPKFLYYN